MESIFLVVVFVVGTRLKLGFERGSRSHDPATAVTPVVRVGLRNVGALLAAHIQRSALFASRTTVRVSGVRGDFFPRHGMLCIHRKNNVQRPLPK